MWLSMRFCVGGDQHIQMIINVGVGVSVMFV